MKTVVLWFGTRWKYINIFNMLMMNNVVGDVE